MNIIPFLRCIYECKKKLKVKNGKGGLVSVGYFNCNVNLVFLFFRNTKITYIVKALQVQQCRFWIRFNPDNTLLSSIVFQTICT